MKYNYNYMKGKLVWVHAEHDYFLSLSINKYILYLLELLSILKTFSEYIRNQLQNSLRP